MLGVGDSVQIYQSVFVSVPLKFATINKKVVRFEFMNRDC